MNDCKCSVKIKNLTVKKGNNVILYNVNLTAHHGETLALIGKNGAGKTTLLKAILGSINFKGEINFFNSKGQEILNPKIGYVPQRLSFDRHTPITVMDLFCANSTSVPVWLCYRKKSKRKAIEILERVGAQNHVNKPIGRLSGGELQRVLLALALDPMPDILLLDEPVSAVDRAGINQFYSLINTMRKDYHMPVLLVSHDLGHVIKYASSYALIDHGVAEVDFASNLPLSYNVRKTFGLDPGGEVWK